MRPELIPAILVKTKTKLIKELKQVKKDVKYIQIDIMDGKFVKNKTIQAKDFKNIKSKLKYEIQLMVKDPINYLDDFKKLKAKTIIFHIESTKNNKEINKIIKEIKNKKMKSAIAINPRTKAERIKPYLKKVDEILVMTVQPGKQGQKFIPSTLKKVEQIRKWNKTINIEVDGGINIKNIHKCVKAGANKLVVGSAIFKKKNIHKTIKNIKMEI